MDQIRFLESTDNIKRITKLTVGRTPSAGIANQISACLQQGRLFFESASKASPIIKPIEIYYGILSFSAAIWMGKRLQNFYTLPAAHGIAAVISNDIEEAKVKIGVKGSFQSCNDVVCDFEGMKYFGDHNQPLYKRIPFTKSDMLTDQELSLKDIWSRIPSLVKAYEMTFNESSNLMSILINDDKTQDFSTLRVDESTLYTDRKSMCSVVNTIRAKNPFLNEWCLVEVDMAWGNSVFQFAPLVKNGVDDLDEKFLLSGNGINYRAHSSNSQNMARFEIFTNLPPLLGGLSGEYPLVVKPFNGLYISEYSLITLGIYLLSSLARYHPEKWGNLVSYKTDKYSAILEEFMNGSLSLIPRMVKSIFHEDFSKL